MLGAGEPQEDAALQSLGSYVGLLRPTHQPADESHSPRLKLQRLPAGTIVLRRFGHAAAVTELAQGQVWGEAGDAPPGVVR
jgi:hypothetical protein